MPHKELNIELRPSKYYLLLATTIYSISLLALWVKINYIVINLIITALVIISFINLVQKHILITKKDSIKALAITKDNSSFTTKDNKIHVDYKYLITYKSNFLIIIRIKKRYIVIFKDAIINKNLSDINKFINIINV